jgi:hypothetical protein
MKKLAGVLCLAILLLSGCAQRSGDPPPSRLPGPAYNGSMGGGDGGGGGGGDGGGM